MIVDPQLILEGHCDPPRLKIGQKININVFGKKYKIIAGKNEKTTVVKEIIGSDDDEDDEVEVDDEGTPMNNKMKVQIDKECLESSSDSQSLESEEEDDISMHDSNAQSGQSG